MTEQKAKDEGRAERATPEKRPEKQWDEVGLTQVVVAHVYDVPMRALRGRARSDAHTAFARQVAMYLAHITYGLSLTVVAKGFGRDRSTASHACHRIEDLRDDPKLDQSLDRLEVLLREASLLEGAAP